MKLVHIVGLLAFACLFSSVAVSNAMTLHTVEKTCPYDGTIFKFEEQGSGTAFDKTLDLMPVGAIRSPWPLAVCPTNGFVFIKSEYKPEELERLRPIVLSAEYQALKDETAYYRAAWIMQRDGAPHADVSRYLLQATWEAGQQELYERYQARPATAPELDFKEFMAEGTRSERYRRYATELLARLAQDIAAAPTESAAFKILTGELLRRLGRFDEAEEHFKALAGDFDVDGIVARIIAFERELIAKRNIGIHFMSKVPGSPRR